MSVEIKVPVLPESVADAVMMEWHKNVGDHVERDENIVDIETEKVVLEVPAPESGVLSEIIANAGDTVLSGDLIARIESGTSADGQSNQGNGQVTQAPTSNDVATSAAGVTDTAQPVHTPATNGNGHGNGNGAFLSPAVRRLVTEHNLDISKVSASGKDGRVTKEDVLRYFEQQSTPPPSNESAGVSSAAMSFAGTDVQPTQPISDEPLTEPDVASATEPYVRPQLDPLAKQNTPTPPQGSPASKAAEPSQSKSPAPQPAPAQASTTPGSVISTARAERHETMSRLRKTIARRLVESQQNAALLTTFNEVDLKEVIDLRNKYKDTFQTTHGVKLGFMSFFVKASVEALKRYPVTNAYVDGDEIVYHDYYDIGIAVSSPRGLVVPILRDADRKNFAEIETEIAHYGDKAREGKLSLEELTGGTFTISNGGVFGSMLSTPIVNPPQSAILGMHKIQQRAVVVDGEIVARPMMYLALSYDHRIIDGREAVQFLVTIKESLEDPARLILSI